MIKHVWGPLDVIDVLRESGIDGSVDETAVICLGEESEVKVVVAIEGDRPFKAIVNDALRAGLDALDTEQETRKPRRSWTKSVDLGGCLVGDIANIQEVLTQVEGPWRR